MCAAQAAQQCLPAPTCLPPPPTSLPRHLPAGPAYLAADSTETVLYVSDTYNNKVCASLHAIATPVLWRALRVQQSRPNAPCVQPGAASLVRLHGCPQIKKLDLSTLVTSTGMPGNSLPVCEQTQAHAA